MSFPAGHPGAEAAEREGIIPVHDSYGIGRISPRPELGCAPYRLRMPCFNAEPIHVGVHEGQAFVACEFEEEELSSR